MAARICITTAYDDKYHEMGEMCKASLIRYAQTFNYDYRIFENRPVVRDAVWEKILIIQELFAEGYEFVFWVDADTIFARFDQDIGTEIVPDKHLYLTFSTQTFVPMPDVSTTLKVPLAGFLFLRNVEWSHHLLEAIWNKTEYLYTPARDNLALFDLLGYHYLRDLILHPGKQISEQRNRPERSYWDFIKRLDSSWHGLKAGPYFEPVADPVVIHYPAQPLDQRLVSMRRDYARCVTKTAPPLVTTFDYDFSQPVDGDGWYPPEYSQIASYGFRWSGRKAAKLNVPLAPGHDYAISFRLLQTLDAETQAQFRVLVNDLPISLQDTPADYGFCYTGIIPGASLEQAVPPAALTFFVPTLYTAQEFYDSHDMRPLGAAIADLHIRQV